MRLTNKKYGLDVDPQNLSPELFYNCDKTFGYFSEDGRSYTVTDKNTPRAWFQYLCNDNFFSAITNKGLGFTCYKLGLFRVTKYYEEMNYLPRIPNGARKIYLKDKKRGILYDFFEDASNLTFTVRPGEVEYEGSVADVFLRVTIFVPECDSCECWKIEIINSSDRLKEYQISFAQDWAFAYLGNDPISAIEQHDGGVTAVVNSRNLFKELYGYFSVNASVTSHIAQYKETVWGKEETFTKVTLVQDISIEGGKKQTYIVVSGACEDRAECDRVKSNFESEETFEKELVKVREHWSKKIEKNSCTVPDKNFERFINVWLKNQLDLTYRYSRMYNTGYRDNMQDAWGYSLVDTDGTREKMLEGLSYMYTDGRCARTYNLIEGHMMKDDFCDSPVWIPNTLTTYIKETGDYAILDVTLPYLESQETGSVKEHVLRSLELLWKLRGKNGLVLMREGDWLDGLSGIQKYGDDATSAWCTIAAFWAQNQLAELFDEIGDVQNATLMKERSAEYKKAFNEVAWDGKWCAYAFFEDGEPIGSHKNYEGKIYLNAQTWAIFSGILDDERKVQIIEKSVQRYLMTPFGCQLMQPPYVFYGDRCGRIHRQIPGTFANGAIYNHAASMKIFSDAARGDGDDAYDTFVRACPNNMDNSDLRRTSEPWCVGNVYYGPDHSHYGMNLFTWFTGAAAWLMQGGYTQILGVSPDYHGIKIKPNVPFDWDEYDVRKTYRDSIYNIHFERSKDGEKGIWLDGDKINGNIVKTEKPSCQVLVKY